MGMTIPISFADIGRQVRAKQVSALEVVDSHLRRIESLNPVLNAFVCIAAEPARERARAIDREAGRGDELPPLCGVPVSIKSSIDVAGLRCEAGSRLRAGNIASHDAPLVQRLKAAGAIVLGVTNTPEMLMAYETDNLLYGRTLNPWDPAHSSGGSSGGEAAAIASGMSAGGVGSDGGGSIRVPAHFTGICGLKPTPGRLPGTGHFPECAGPWATLGVVGPVARTVDDVRTLWKVMAGPDDGDPMSAPVSTVEERLNLKGARIAVLEADDARTDDATTAAVDAAAAALAASGAIVEPLRIAEFGNALRVWQTIFCRATALMIHSAAAGREDELSPILKDFLRYACEQPPLTAESLLVTLVERDQIRARALAQMHPYVAILAPVSSAPAFRHGEGGWGAQHPANYIETMRHSQFANALGLPAASVPGSRSAAGLPIGVQVIGRPYQEAEVLAVAEIVESAFGFAWPG